MSETGCIRRDTSHGETVPDIYVTPQYVRSDTPAFGERPDKAGVAS